MLAARQHVVEQHNAFAQRLAGEQFPVKPEHTIERSGGRSPRTDMVRRRGFTLMVRCSQIQGVVDESSG